MYWSIIEGFRDLRYHINYAKIDYIQRYYSTSHNPRVIQARIGNEQLLSLRTYPQDEYLVKPGQFLVLEKRCKMEDLRNELMKFQSAGPESSSKLPPFNNDDFLNFSRLSSFQEGEEEQEDQENQEEELISIQEKETDNIEIGNIIDSDQEVRVEVHSSAEDKEELPKKSLKQRLKSFKTCYSGMHSSSLLQSGQMLIPSPILETLSGAQLVAKEKEQEDAGKIEEDAREDQCKNRRESEIPPSSVCSKQSNGSEVWKNVLNDISLSAARVSIGYPPKSKQHFKNLSSDFIDAEMIYLQENDKNILYSPNRAVSEGYTDMLRNKNTKEREIESVGNYYDDLLSVYELTRKD
ncbi:hypothetical protein CLIB1423_04S07030 [[Candida] railenensis]|uniref:Uncharacterized protein n=1 Tax=[Candida] railenensis TaxID=45579 RepID=A0A9P0QM82_9ASCO|nr:hypothetical protein CLIB1423_04S07030 [[Candida] railenensis]